MMRKIALQALAAMMLFGLTGAAVAQDGWTVSQSDDWCDNSRGWRNKAQSYCEVRTTTIDPRGTIDVDGNMNGGIRVEGWNRNEIELQAKVTVWDRGEDVSADEISIDIDGTTIRSDGPSASNGSGWAVSFRLMVPERSDLELAARNGGISIRGVDGRIRFRTQNGGVKLRKLAGDVQGRTQNGGLSVELDGRTWYGEGLDVETTNGGVSMDIPEDYDAELVTGTVNGNLRIDFPVMVKGEIGKRLTTTLGSGGPTVRATTTNGGVTIEKS